MAVKAVKLGALGLALAGWSLLLAGMASLQVRSPTAGDSSHRSLPGCNSRQRAPRRPAALFPSALARGMRYQQLQRVAACARGSGASLEVLGTRLPRT